MSKIESYKCPTWTAILRNVLISTPSDIIDTWNVTPIKCI
jgi:hypothetical protein